MKDGIYQIRDNKFERLLGIGDRDEKWIQEWANLTGRKIYIRENGRTRLEAEPKVQMGVSQ